LDGQIWALKADSLTSPLICNCITVTDADKSLISETIKLVGLRKT